MRKILLMCVAFIISAAAASASPAATAGRLPDIDGWINGVVRVTKLETVSGNRGTWLERDYRTAAGVPLHAVWIDGAGEKGWDVSDKEISADDGPLGTGATYKTISAAGERAILEHHPVTGYSLTARIDKLGVLTLESKAADEGEIISAADVLIGRIISDAKGDADIKAGP